MNKSIIWFIFYVKVAYKHIKHVANVYLLFFTPSSMFAFGYDGIHWEQVTHLSEGKNKKYEKKKNFHGHWKNYKLIHMFFWWLLA